MENADRVFGLHVPFPPPSPSLFDVTPSTVDVSPWNYSMENQLPLNLNNSRRGIHNQLYHQNSEPDDGLYLQDFQRANATDHGRRSTEYQQLQRMLMQSAVREEMLMTEMHDKFINLFIGSQNFRPNREVGNQFRPTTTTTTASSLNDLRRFFNVRRSSSTQRNSVTISNPMPSTATQTFAMEDIKGRVLLEAKDQYGCRLLQEKLEEGVAEEVEVIFSELKDHFHELMVDQFGNYLVQKIFETSDAERMSYILASIVGDRQKFVQVCFDNYGTRVVQKLLEFLQTPEQIATAISAIKPITVTLIKNVNGGHVIQQCVTIFAVAYTKSLLDVIAENCLEIATDKRGCCTLQHCLAFVSFEALKSLVNKIISCSLVLSENPYGNYVVQYMIGLNITHITRCIILQLSGSYVQLSMDKFGSNVVEELLKSSQQEDVTMIVDEIVYSHYFLNVLQDPYGNYVVQTALKETKRIPGFIHNILVNGVLSNYAFLHSHPHGKRVLACIKGGSSRRA